MAIQWPSKAKPSTNQASTELYMAVWLSRQNHVEEKDVEKVCMKLSISAIDITNIPVCNAIQEIQRTTQNDIHLQDL